MSNVTRLDDALGVEVQPEDDYFDLMADVAATLVRKAARVHGRLPVILTGGCFQNARLAEGVLRRLQGDFAVRLHGEVPPGDGGIALGQALVADAVTGP